MEVTGRTVTVPEKRIVHPHVGYIAAHPDGITGDGRLVEIKTARSTENWGTPGTDEIPQAYTIQVQIQMMVTQIPICDVPVLFGGSDFQLYEVASDSELQAAILEALAEFWGHVQRGEPPPIDYRSAHALAVLKRLYPGTDGTTVDADERCIQVRAELETAKGFLDKATESRDAAQAELLDYMKNAALLRFPDGKALRRQLTSRREYVVKASEFIATRWVRA
jgi:predicted phage-related endonuclease